MKKGVFWALALILAAVLLLTDAILGTMGIAFFEGISLGKCFLGVVLAALMLSGLFNLGAGRFFMSAAFLFMLFEKEIACYAGLKSENILSNWLVFFCGVLLSIGFGILFSRLRKIIMHKNMRKKGVTVYVHRFSDTVQYADCTCKEHSFENTMGQLNIYFENVDRYEGDTQVFVVNHMGAVILHVPSNWCVDCNITNHMGHVETKKGNPEGKKLFVTGTNHMGVVEFELI